MFLSVIFGTSNANILFHLDTGSGVVSRIKRRFLRSPCRLDVRTFRVSTKAVDPVKTELLVRKAEVSDTWFWSSAARSGVDDGVPDATVLHPPRFTAVQELELPSSVQLAHFSNDCVITLTSF